MNIIEKRADKKLKENRLLKEQKNRLENTKKFSKKFDIKVIYQNIDFIVLKIETKNKNLRDIEENLKSVYTFKELSIDFDFKRIPNSLKLFDKFVLVHAWLTFWNQKKLYDLYDFDKNKIWQIVLKNTWVIKRNNNVINSLELSWLFFKSYNEYFLQILSYFWIEDNKQNIIKRIDYCVDFKWIEVFELSEYIKKIYIKSFSIKTLNSSDLKKLKETNKEVKIWNQTTYRRYETTHNDLKIYDKILDILQNYKKRKVNWKNPYADYLNSDFPITRIELKKKKFNNLTDNSLNWVFNNIEALFFDYLLRYFDIDLSLYAWVDKTLNWKKIFLAKEEKSKNLYHSITMLLAYAKNIEELTSKENLFKILLNKYPELEKLSSLSLLDEFETHELLAEIFPKK